MISPQEMLAFVEHVRDIRKAQENYRVTLNPRLKNDLPRLCAQLDAEALAMADALAIDAADQPLWRMVELVEDLAKLPFSETSGTPALVLMVARARALTQPAAVNGGAV